MTSRLAPLTFGFGVSDLEQLYTAACVQCAVVVTTLQYLINVFGYRYVFPVAISLDHTDIVCN
jgi:hypothetical protein